MGKQYTVCTVQIRKMPVLERYMHVYWAVLLLTECALTNVTFAFSVLSCTLSLIDMDIDIFIDSNTFAYAAQCSIKARVSVQNTVIQISVNITYSKPP